MNKLSIAIGLVSLLMLSSCKKEEGSGGTSAIVGNVSGKIYSNSGGNSAESEITQIIIPEGGKIEDEDYVLLNTPNGGTLYYLWFHWVSSAQAGPNLGGRIPIKVSFNFTESNSVIASNTVAELNSIAGADFTITLNNDIITLTNKVVGEVSDADELSKGILVDIQNQGKSALTGSTSFVEGPIVDERVYLTYGEDDFYSETARTDEDGNYQFKDLNRGNYRVFAFSVNEQNPNGIDMEVEVAAEITKKKDVVVAPDILLIK